VATKIDGRNDNTRWRSARQLAIRRANGRCQLCQGPLVPEAPAHTPDTTEVDHLEPLSHGGDAYAQDNLRAVHGFDHRGWFDGLYWCGQRCAPHSEDW
jgi:5-methylcytosine-specific restriction endonuclease McrA